MTFLIDYSLLSKPMDQISYFVFNKENAKDGREYSFYFRVVTDKACPQNRTYTYSGVKGSSQ